ncbi:hypothetical protein GW846_02410 [Candidatus Gracilibacteria bacterium]|nr:hypothetical protein [Candidatus Gracilibacteria bacterium]
MNGIEHNVEEELDAGVWNIRENSKLQDWVANKAMEILLLDEARPKVIYNTSRNGDSKEGIYFVDFGIKELEIRFDGNNILENKKEAA